MEIKFTGRGAAVIVGAAVLLGVMRKAVKKANDKSLEAAIYKFSDHVNELRIKQLEEENTKLKSEAKRKES